MSAAGAWYAQSGGKLHELYTILHLPYTSMVLSYVLVGAAFSPFLYPDRLILTLLAYFLGLGISAHALNELHARHWGKALSELELKILFAAPLFGAVFVGTYGMFVLFAASGTLFAPLVLLAFMGVEVLFLFGYNIDFFGGRLHSDVSFAFSWAALPTLISYYVNSLAITPVAILVALAMAATAGMEINLSRWCKNFRREKPLAEIRFEDNTRVELRTAELIAKPEKALKLLVLAVDLFAISLIIHRMFG